MSIGHKVRAAEEAKERIKMDSLDEGADTPDPEPVSRVTKVPPKPKAVVGALTALQVRDLVAKGLAIGDVRSLAEAGMTFEEIGDIAEAQAQTLRHVPSGADAFTAMQAQNATFMEKVLEKARNRRPESYNGDFPYHGKSAFAPEGLSQLEGNVLPPLKCEMFLGIWEKGNPQTGTPDKAVPVYPIIADDTGGASLEERQLLNNLRAGVFTVERRDEQTGQVRVVVNEDADGQPTRLTIAVPKRWMEKGEHRALPSLRQLARQLQPEAVSA